MNQLEIFTKGATQCETVLAHLKNYGSLTSWEAIEKYHITRTASRINDLRNEGHAISSEMVYNGNKRFAKYTLK